TQPVTIDGYTQPGAAANTSATGNNAVLRIELNGASAGPGANGFTITAGTSTVKGLVINRFLTNPATGNGGNGIEVRTKGGNNIQGNFLGTDATGTIDLGNACDGVFI